MESDGFPVLLQNHYQKVMESLVVYLIVPEPNLVKTWIEKEKYSDEIFKSKEELESFKEFVESLDICDGSIEESSSQNSSLNSESGKLIHKTLENFYQETLPDFLDMFRYVITLYYQPSKSAELQDSGETESMQDLSVSTNTTTQLLEELENVFFGFVVRVFSKLQTREAEAVFEQIKTLLVEKYSSDRNDEIFEMLKSKYDYNNACIQQTHKLVFPIFTQDLNTVVENVFEISKNEYMKNVVVGKYSQYE